MKSYHVFVRCTEIALGLGRGTKGGDVQARVCGNEPEEDSNSQARLSITLEIMTKLREVGVAGGSRLLLCCLLHVVTKEEDRLHFH